MHSITPKHRSIIQLLARTFSLTHHKQYIEHNILLKCEWSVWFDSSVCCLRKLFYFNFTTYRYTLFYVFF